MFFMITFSFSIICASLFMFMKHPMAMGLMLMIQTIIIALSTGMMMKTFWFSYVLFLIFIGGMLVLFIYVISLASNEMFNISTKMFMISLLFMLVFLSFAYFYDKNLYFFLFDSMDKENINFLKSFTKENSLNLMKLYNFPMNLITIILMIYLFLTLIAIVKITNIFEGPLRPKFN